MSRLRHKRSEHSKTHSRASGGAASLPRHGKAKHISGEGEAPKPHAGKRARGGWIKSAIHHPGRERARAERNGVTVHEQLERDSHSSDPSLRGAGTLGLRLSAMAKSRKHKAKP